MASRARYGHFDLANPRFGESFVDFGVAASGLCGFFVGGPLL